MKYFTYAIFILMAGIYIWACDTCNDCGPVENDPYVNLSFYYLSDSSSAEIIIDSINGIAALNINEELYADTAQIFRLPLNYNTDSSFFDLVFSNYPEKGDSLRARETRNEQVAFKYNLQLVNKDDFLKYEADSLRVVYSTFDSIATQSINPEEISNAINLQVYF
ncbi:MAG: hypothetical protein ACOCXH_06680 [Cyclobacteriaceae bacterium]